MEQILIPGPAHQRGSRVTLVDLISGDEGAEIDFEPRRLGLRARTPELHVLDQDGRAE